MSPSDLHLTLTTHPFFSDLRDAHIAALEQHVSDVCFAANDWLLREGGSADAFYLLKSGNVALSTFMPARRDVVLQTLHADDVLGWSWLFPPAKWHFDARAINDVTAFKFDAAPIRQLAQQDHEFGYQLMSQFTKIILARLQAARRQQLDVYG